MIERKLLELAGRRIRFLMVNMPPRHGKSELISKYFPAWYLGLFPTHRVILTSYQDGFAASYGRRVRDIVSAYGHLFGTGVKADVSAQADWETWQGGGMLTAGVGGAIMGRGADLIIIDDPHKNAEEALSQTMRDKVWDFWQSSLFQRLMPGGIVVVIQTRWHEDDLSGRALAETGEHAPDWEVLSLPALAEEADPLGRVPGEPLWPEQYDLKALLERKAVAGSFWWSALYQQSPVPLGNTLFRKAWSGTYQHEHGIFALKRPGEAGARLFTDRQCVRFGTMDLAVSQKESADYTVLSSWAMTPERDLILLDVDRRKLEAPDQPGMMRKALSKWGLKFIGVESTAYQLSLVQYARREGIPVRALKADKDKVARALTASAYQEGGKLFLPEWAPWLADFEAELYKFPSVAHDDQTDTVSYAAIYAGNRAAQGSA